MTIPQPTPSHAVRISEAVAAHRETEKFQHADDYAFLTAALAQEWEPVGGTAINDLCWPHRAVFLHRTDETLLLFYSNYSHRLLPIRGAALARADYRLEDDLMKGLCRMVIGDTDTLIDTVLAGHRETMWTNDSTQWLLAHLTGHRAQAERMLLALADDDTLTYTASGTGASPPTSPSTGTT